MRSADEKELGERARVAEHGQSYVLVEGEHPIVELSLGETLRAVAAAAPDQIALKEPTDVAGLPGRTWTYAQLLAEAERAARAMLVHFRPGEHVAVWSGNRPEWLIAQYGAALAGLVVVAINPASREKEAHYALAQSRSVGVLYGRSYRDVDAQAVVTALRPRLHALRECILFEEWTDFLAGAPRDTPLPQVPPGLPLMIQYTSGTTGDPKAAMLSHRGIVNNARFSAARFELEPHSTWYCAVPMFHTAGCVYASLGALWNHGTVLMASSFDPGRMIDAIENDAVSWSNLVPTMVLRLLEERLRRPEADLSSLKIVVCGGSVVSPELIRRVESELGCDFVMVFGQTELCGAATQSYRHDTDHHRSRTIGIPLTQVEAKVIDTTTGATVAIGQQGELCVRGYLSLLEYFDQPDATARTLDHEGWVHTGDIGTMEADGYLTLTGRLKEVINRGGEKIFPREIEDALAEHPAVADSAVFSIPHPQWGEVAVAAVRPAADCVETEDSIKQWLRERIARHKVPQHIYFCSSFPLTPSGKTQKFALREQYLSKLSGSGLHGLGSSS